MNKFRVGLAGARGYTGREFLKILSRHPRIDVAFVTSRDWNGRLVQSEYPESNCALSFENLGPNECADRGVDAYVLAMPNGMAAPYVAAIDARVPNAIIVDLSADYRFANTWQYGLPERHRGSLAGARRIANPGCYATAMQLIAWPLLPFTDGAPHGFGVSGYSGAGTTPSPKNDPAALADSILPYALVDHMHEREVSRQLGREVSFIPHVAPFFRGITLTLSARLNRVCTRDEVFGALADHYRDERLVKVGADVPVVAEARDRHEVHIGGLAVSSDGRHMGVVGTLDNLLGGAATTATRNLNLALGLPELEGISAWLD